MLKHRTFIFLIASLLVAFIVSSAVAQERGIVPVPIKNPQGEQVLLYKESYALVVGVSAYEEGWPTLPGVLKDVELVKYALEEKYFHVTTVINPSFDELRNAIEKFIHRYGQQEDNRLLFYFAGHGHTLKLSYGDEMGYFVPVNAPNPNRDESGFLAKGLNMELIEVFAKQIQAKHALFLFDSCFSGSIFALSRAIPANISYKTSEPVRQFVTAGSADETVPDESIFRDQFIRAIRGEGDSDGDGYVTGIELGEFLQKTVVNYSKGSQHPQYGKIRNPNLDKGDFVFSLLTTDRINKSTAEIIKKREKLEKDRSKIKQERLAAINRLQLEKQQLELEKQSLKEEKERAAKVQTKNEIERIVRERKKLLAEKERLAKIQPTEKTRESILKTLDRVPRVAPKDDPIPEVDKFSSIKEKLGSLGSKHGISKLNSFEFFRDRRFQTVHKVTAPLVNIRSKPSIDSNIIMIAKEGMNLEIIEINQHWSKVSVLGKIGWISNKLFKSEETPVSEVDSELETSDALSTYVGEVYRLIYLKWKTPLGSETKKVVVAFTIFRNGNIDKPVIRESSGDENLDSIAVRAVLDAVPLPPLPEELRRPNLKINIKFKYVPEKN